MSHIKNLFFDELNRTLVPLEQARKPWAMPRAIEHVKTVEREGIELECHFEYTPEERGAREPLTGMQLEPDEPASVTLTHAYAGAVDILPLLSFEMIDDIEGELLP
jgi:hypothetical protein